MKNFFLKIAASLVCAAIVANVGALWNINARLARIETTLSIKTATASVPNLAKIP